MKLKLLVFGLAFSLISSCTYTPKSEESEEAQEDVLKTDKEYTSKYVCPMHCKGSGSNEPGQCPVCNMNYELNPDYKAHDHKYACPMHPEVKGHEGDSCHLCGMALNTSKQNQD